MFPEPLGMHPSITYEQAVSMLIRAVHLASQAPFQWGYIDKPHDGSLYMIFLVPQQHKFPNDGIRYQDQEIRQVIPAGNGRVCAPSRLLSLYLAYAKSYRNWRFVRSSMGSSQTLRILQRTA